MRSRRHHVREGHPATDQFVARGLPVVPIPDSARGMKRVD